MSQIAKNPKPAQSQHSPALLGLSVVPKPTAPGVASPDSVELSSKACEAVQARHLRAAQAAHAAQIDEHVVQATNVAKTNMGALLKDLAQHNLTLRATYMPPAVDSSPVCAEITAEAIAQAVNNNQAVRVPHPLGLGHFDMQCSASGINILQYSVA